MLTLDRGEFLTQQHARISTAIWFVERFGTTATGSLRKVGPAEHTRNELKHDLRSICVSTPTK